VSDVPKIIGSPAANATGYRWFQSLVVIFGVVLACLAVWILTAEFSRPAVLAFPADPESAPDPTVNRKAAHFAARFGAVRGDLWAEDALTYSNLFRREDQNSVDARNSDTIQKARDVAERALRLAPHDARIWLLLAGIRSRFDWLNGKASSAVRMSYYTGGNEAKLIPVRLSLSLSLPSIADKDFQQLVAHDLQLIVTRHPELKPAILTAYRYALPEGQQFIRDTLKELDPKLLANLPQKQ
jgi:hypothetical protein